MKIKSLLWRSACGLAALSLFLVTLMLGAPLSFWLDRVTLPRDLQLGEAHGSLLNGGLASLSGPGWQLGALNWELKPGWPLQAEVDLQVSQQRWAATWQGWPWQWQSRVRPQPSEYGFVRAAAQPGSGFVWQGEWQGEITLAGSGIDCQRASGQVSSDSLQLRQPVKTDFGQVRLTLNCGETTRLQLNTQGAGQALRFYADLESRRSRLRGNIEPGSSLDEPARLLGLVSDGTGMVKRGWRW